MTANAFRCVHSILKVSVYLPWPICFQKKHKKRDRQEVAEEGPNLMADHEELEGDNTPETSPRDEKEPIVENDVGEDKVIIPCMCQRRHVKKYLVIMLE